MYQASAHYVQGKELDEAEAASRSTIQLSDDRSKGPRVNAIHHSRIQAASQQGSKLRIEIGKRSVETHELVVMKSKQPSDYQKCKKRKVDEEKRKVDACALDKFIHRQPVEQHVEEYIEEHVEEQEHVELEEIEEHEHVKELVDIYMIQEGNGNFFGVIEMLQEFDAVIKEHVRWITSEGLHVHYLGHLIQNELISLVAKEIKKEFIKKIKEAKYYSIILDCILDSSHQEQITIIVSEATSLAEKELGDFKFLVSTVIWYEDYRETSFSKMIVEAKEISIEMSIDPIFPQKRLIERKKRFDESSSSEEVSFIPEEIFRVNYFLYSVDQAISSIETRFEQFKEYDKVFGFYFHII
ncbi:uncharacterized protein LOC111903903 [Lactuca sativa]|uniref:uncharacterized protein LOC111903903 n=1 Tax=Lactuca sativa TaxID=4236 RepID=UPI000CD8E2BE|nr:uncharacterized protein LOC111903903 [Lactuca sativa]